MRKIRNRMMAAVLSGALAAGAATALLPNEGPYSAYAAEVQITGLEEFPAQGAGTPAARPSSGDITAGGPTQENITAEDAVHEDAAEDETILPGNTADQGISGDAAADEIISIEPAGGEMMLDEMYTGISGTAGAYPDSVPGAGASAQEDAETGSAGAEIPETESLAADTETALSPDDVVVEEIETLETAITDLDDTENLRQEAGRLNETIQSQSSFYQASSTEISSNLGAQNYNSWASPIYSYLAEDGSDYLRVENCSDGVLVERYNSMLELQSQMVLPRELPLFGGFYAGSSAYYLVFGAPNDAEDDNAEVVRIVKYDHAWNRLGAASLRGANTTIPFDAGSLRMAEYGGYLYIRTSHQMYTSPDRLRHQANLMIQVRTSDMAITDYFADVMNVSCGYVSHSFNRSSLHVFVPTTINE